ncbi:glycosyltransferase [Pannonibacter sp. P2PFMT1]|uniref:glycosyltransferase n=1 Tax=Pannonibacter sp. P2PFMT1 TaxID=2003582 RepID=UPI00164448AB|nr:glycosyltransferase [Pannonibacter sp. P2PFMT1]
MTKHFKILHIIGSVNPAHGGPVEGIRQHALERDRQGIADTHVVSLDAPSDPWLRNMPFKVFALGAEATDKTGLRRFTPLRKYRYSPALATWLKSNLKHYDIVVVNGIWNYAALAARRALVGSGYPYVVFTHGMLDPWFKRTYPIKHWAKQLVWLFSEGPLLNNARAVFFTTEEERVVAEGAFWPYRLRARVVPYGTADIAGSAETQLAAFRSALPSLHNRQYLLFLSRIHEKKGCDLLIEAFASIASTYPDLDLVIAGPDQTGWKAELILLAERLQISHRIHWPGMLEGDEKWGAFRGAEAFVLPSHQENFGIVVAEALAAGTPALISDKVNIWREVDQAGAGLVGSDDLAGTQFLLSSFMALDKKTRISMRLVARELFLSKFEIQAVALAIVERLKEESFDRAA